MSCRVNVLTGTLSESLSKMNVEDFYAACLLLILTLILKRRGHCAPFFTLTDETETATRNNKQRTAWTKPLGVCFLLYNISHTATATCLSIETVGLLAVGPGAFLIMCTTTVARTILVEPSVTETLCGKSKLSAPSTPKTTMAANNNNEIRDMNMNMNRVLNQGAALMDGMQRNAQAAQRNAQAAHRKWVLSIFLVLGIAQSFRIQLSGIEGRLHTVETQLGVHESRLGLLEREMIGLQAAFGNYSSALSEQTFDWERFPIPTISANKEFPFPTFSANKAMANNEDDDNED